MWKKLSKKFMDERTQKYLYDVISAVEETLGYFEERPKVLRFYLPLLHDEVAQLLASK